MLSILINNQSIELYRDIAISLQYPNPFFEDDAIVTPYSFDFDLPLTPKNNQIFGWRTRIASSEAIDKEYPAKILFQGREIISGHVIVTSVKVEECSMSVQFLAADFLSDLKSKLYEIDLGTIDYGEARTVYNRRTGKNEIVPAATINRDIATYWLNLNNKYTPEYATPTLIVDGVDWRENANARINEPDSLAKLPSVRVAYLLNCIKNGLGDWLEDSFSTMMLICYYHPNFRSYTDDYVHATSDRYLFNIKDMRVILKVQDVMPSVSTADFVKELLKLTSASLYTVGGAPVIVPNNDVLTSTDCVDWSNQFIDSSVSISYLKPQHYVLSLSSTSSDSSIDGAEPLLEYAYRDALITSAAPQLDNPTEDELSERDLCKTNYTQQIFERKVDSELSGSDGTHYNFELVKDRPVADSDSELDKYEVNCSISPARVVIGELTTREPERGFVDGVTKVPYVVAPEVPNAENIRPTDLIVANHEGLRNTILNGEGKYPFASDQNVNHTYLLAHQHESFSKWVAKNRKIIDADIRLGVDDIKTLDLRKKVYYKGQYFLLKNLSITLTLNAIEPAEVTLVEV